MALGSLHVYTSEKFLLVFQRENGSNFNPGDMQRSESLDLWRRKKKICLQSMSGKLSVTMVIWLAESTDMTKEFISGNTAILYNYRIMCWRSKPLAIGPAYSSHYKQNMLENHWPMNWPTQVEYITCWRSKSLAQILLLDQGRSVKSKLDTGLKYTLTKGRKINATQQTISQI